MKAFRPTAIPPGVAALLLASAITLTAQSPPCAATELTAQQKQNLLRYVGKKYKLPSSIALSLAKEGFVGATCYRESTFQGKSEIRTWDLTLFVSPDLRFLAGELMDTQRDPEEEERAQNLALMNGLTQGATAARGPENAAVTLVEFSDFQCPFCRKFALILDEALADEPLGVRVVFHHMPLGMHDWARVAAEGAACAQLQSPRAFWGMYDRIFRDQQTLTADNIKEKLSEFAKDAKEIDSAAFDRCMRDSMSLGIVLRDLNLAEANQVAGTPTLFLNGHRLQGVENAARLRELIAEARREGESPGEKNRASAAAPPGPEVCTQAPHGSESISIR